MKKKDHLYFMKEAINEAEIGLKEGGIPIGSILVNNNKIVGRGRLLQSERVASFSIE